MTAPEPNLIFYGLNDWQITAITYLPGGARIIHYGGTEEA